MATTRKRASAKSGSSSSPFAERKAAGGREAERQVHVFGNGVVCDTDTRGFARPRGRSPLEIVLDASEGFIPLWAKDTTLRWRFREHSLKHFAKPAAARAEIRKLFGESLLAWGNATPVKFAERNDTWDFEIVVRPSDNCSNAGCVLASAFFPDGGRHKLVIYPKMFKQTRKEQIETFAHEIGHIFGLRHFFADVREQDWPVEIFGTHERFSIMNYGADSALTEADKADLKRLYQAVWKGELTEINGTPIKLVQPFHALAAPSENIVSIGAGSPFTTGPFAQPIAAYTRL
jgi:hypothetical protein